MRVSEHARCAGPGRGARHYMRVRIPSFNVGKIFNDSFVSGMSQLS